MSDIFEIFIFWCSMMSAWGIWACVGILKDIRKLLSATTDPSTKGDGK